MIQSNRGGIMVEVKQYTNKRNPNKHIEVRHYSCGHYYAVQYMKWENTKIGTVINKLGSRTGRMFRMSKRSLATILEDYVLEV